MALNIKQEAFCLHYAKTGNATESYKKAGYSAKTDNAIYANSNRLLKNDKVKARLKELADELASEKIASIREIQEYLTSVMRRETESCVLARDITGADHVIKKHPDEKERLKAAETLAKMQGGFDNKLSLELTVPVFVGENEFEAEEE